MASSDWLRSSGLLSALSTQDFFHFTALQLMELMKLAQFKRCWTGSFIVAFSSCMKNIAPSWFQIRFVICANNYCTFLTNQIFKFKNLPKHQDSKCKQNRRGFEFSYHFNFHRHIPPIYIPPSLPFSLLKEKRLIIS